MKKLPLIFAALFFAAAVQAAPQADLIARIHFAGVEKISADINSLTFTNEFCSAEAQALKTQTLEKLSVALDGWLRQKTGATVADGAAKLRPLLDDLQKSAWFLEARVDAGGKPEVALAVKLDDSRAQFWRANLQPFFASATFRQSGGWLIVNCVGDSLKLGDGLAQKISVADNNWLDVDLNWSRLAQFFPSLENFDFPETHLQVSGHDGNFQMNGKLIMSQPLPPLEKWQMPTNAIRQPLVSFTAARGFAPWLEKKNLPYEISPVPDQILIWALAQVPFQTFAAVPVPNAENALAQLGRKMSANTNWQHHFLVPFPMTVSSNQISWQCGPFMIMPNVTALHEPSGDFLFAGFFPNGPRKKQPLPPDLFARLAQPGLVYYHWEITAERLQELPQFSQLALMLTKHQQVNVQSAAGKWLDKIGPTLGNTVTEIFQTAPDELTFSRKSPGGLNALELLAFVDWLEAPNFPAFDLRLPPVRPHLKNRRIPMTAPMPAPQAVPSSH
jgi:hypothetical protein